MAFEGLFEWEETRIKGHKRPDWAFVNSVGSYTEDRQSEWSPLKAENEGHTKW